MENVYLSALDWKRDMLNREDIKFPTTSRYGTAEIQKAQSILLDMVKVITEILERSDISYSLAFGSLIGAVKFQGFLPWDDDIDLFLFDEEYDKAMACLEEELPVHLVVHSEKNDPNYFLAWNSVKNINTTIEVADIYNSDNKLLAYRCLGVDLYRLKKLRPNDISNYKYEEAVSFFERKKRAGIIDEGTFQSELGKLKRRESEQDDTIAPAGREKHNGYVYYFILKLNNYLLQEDLFPLKRYKFESMDLYGPRNCHAVLQSSFGDYRKLPEYNNRLPHISYLELK